MHLILFHLWYIHKIITYNKIVFQNMNIQNWLKLNVDHTQK